MDALVPLPDESDEALAQRVLARALAEEIDWKVLAKRGKDDPESLSPAEVQYLAAFLVALEQ